MAIVSAFLFILSVWLTGFRQPYAFFISIFRGWEFAIGGLAALVSPISEIFAKNKYFQLIDQFITSRIPSFSAIQGWIGFFGILYAGMIDLDTGS